MIDHSVIEVDGQPVPYLGSAGGRGGFMLASLISLAMAACGEVVPDPKPPPPPNALDVSKGFVAPIDGSRQGFASRDDVPASRAMTVSMCGIGTPELEPCKCTFLECG